MLAHLIIFCITSYNIFSLILNMQNNLIINRMGFISMTMFSFSMLNIKFTHKTKLHFLRKVRNKVNIRNQYNQVPHLASRLYNLGTVSDSK